MTATRPLRVLTFSTLYPNAASPGHGLFVEQRLRQLLATEAVEARVLAPVPWFPSTHPRFGEYARAAAAPRVEERHGISIAHPRYLVLPKIGMWLTPLTLALAAWPTLRRWRREGWEFDLIDAHYYYPDGVAAALLARWLGKPLVVTARGSDVNQIAGLALPRRMIRWAARVAAASVGVSAALAERLRSLGIPGERVQVLRNGVDTTRFFPVPQAEARRRIGGPLQGPRLVTVGNLVPVKGHALLLEALSGLPGWHLDVVGRGPLEGALRAQALALGLAERVRFVGAVAQEELPWHFAAADLSVLASEREGWPNVLLESMACGTPVVAARVGGVPEIVRESCAGVMFEPRTAAALRDAIDLYFPQRPSPEEVRRHAAAFGWDETSRGQRLLFARILESCPHA